MRMDSRRPVRRVRPIVVGAIAAVLLGLALTLQVKSWWTLSAEAGGSCGSSRGFSHGPCPRGIGWMIPVSLVSLFVLVPLTLFGTRLAPSRALGRIGAVLLVTVGVFPGLAVFGWAHGRSLTTVWAAPPERPSSVEGLGSWLHGDTVIRARFDGLVGYDVATGARRWTYTVPGQNVLCAMSRTAPEGIGLIAHGPETRPCAQVVAVDLDGGRVLWERGIAADGSSSVTPDVLAVTADAAVMRTSQVIQAGGLRNGDRRWEQKAPDLCRFGAIAADHDQVLAEVTCAAAVPRIRAVDAVTGRPRWEAPAPIRGTSAAFTVLSADPAVVHVAEGGQRGVNVVVAFDGQGRPRTTIEVDDGTRRLDTGDHGFRAAPVRALFVQDGMLVARARFPDGRERVLAYGLEDGRSRWSVDIDDIGSMRATGDRLLIIGRGPRSPGLWSVTLRDGARRYLGVTDFDWVIADLALYSAENRFVVVAERATTPRTFPVAAVR